MQRKKGMAVPALALALAAAAAQVPAGAMAATVLTRPAVPDAEAGGTGDAGPGGHSGHSGQGGHLLRAAAPDDPGGDQGQTSPEAGRTGDPGQNQDTGRTGDPAQQDPAQQDPAQQDLGAGQDNGQGDGQDGGQGQVQQGPSAEDFVDIQSVRPNVQRVRNGRGASRGSFTSRCGRNENGHFNSDNFIVAPGVSNGAHHTHDYVGNLSTDGFSTDESLAAAGTTCARGDRSTYFWPVLRVRDGEDTSAQAAQSAADGNVGRIVTPSSVSLRFQGNPRSRVTAMPRFLRIITGDAKAATNGTANARAQWTCSGFTDRVLTDKYPLCPEGSRVTRILDFPSCWDGQNVDSANHRTHVVFPDRAGACPSGTRAVPQLRMTLTYDVPDQAQAFALDSFPEQLHAPVTDHADFENVMPDRLMRLAVDCINRGRNC
jgi:hypothetical protein